MLNKKLVGFGFIVKKRMLMMMGDFQCDIIYLFFPSSRTSTTYRVQQ